MNSVASQLQAVFSALYLWGIGVLTLFNSIRMFQAFALDKNIEIFCEFFELDHQFLLMTCQLLLHLVRKLFFETVCVVEPILKRAGEQFTLDRVDFVTI